jgi:hypothetical protein
MTTSRTRELANSAINQIIKNDLYELVYSNGGHCGAFKLKGAMNGALDRLKGDKTMGHIDIVNRRTGGAWRVTLTPTDNLDVTFSPKKYRSPFP